MDDVPGGGSPRYVRSRVGNACDGCKARKVKCDGKLPCSYCAGRQRGDSCRYSAQRRRRTATATTHGAHGTTTPPGTVGTGTASPTPDAQQRPLPGGGGGGGGGGDGQRLRRQEGREGGQRTASAPRHWGQQTRPRRQTTTTEAPKRSEAKGDAGRASDATQHQPGAAEAAEDDTEVPREARLLRDAHGKLIFIGDCAPLSFFQSVRQVVTSRVSQHAFAPQTSRYSVLENAPAHPPRRTGGVGGAAAQTPNGSSSPPVHPGDVAAAVSAYLSTTTGMIDLFDNSALLDDLLLWADQQQQQQQQQRPQDGASTVKYLVLAIGRLTDDEALAQDYFEHAKSRAYVDMSGDLSTETVQSFVLITMYMLCSCQINGAFLFFGIAARAAYSIGVHRTEVNARFGEAVHRQRDNLWKSLRALDLFLSTSMGRPPATSDIDCTVSYRTLDDDGNEVLDLLNASVQILLITETIVVEIYSRRKVSLQLTEGISLQLRGWSDRWLQQLKDVITQPGGGGTDDQAQLSGACQVLSTYYYSVMLVSRPFLMYELYRRLSDAPPHRSVAMPSGKTKLADACIDAASLMVDPVLELIELDVLGHRAPMLVSWLFAASLVLGVGLLGGFGRILEKYTRMSIQALDHFAQTDGHATQYSLIAQSLLTTALEDLERRELQERMRRTESSSQLFGLVPHDAHRPSSFGAAGSGSGSGSGAGTNANSPRDAGGSSHRGAALRTPATTTTTASTMATGRVQVLGATPVPSRADGGGGGGSTLRSNSAASPMPWQARRNSDRRPDRDGHYGGVAGVVSPRIGDIDSAFLGLSESMLHTPDADYWSNSFGVSEGDGGAGSAVNLFPLLDAGGGIDLAHYF
ncbi:Fungal specific transcription factor [Cordyceps javanica]|uniref:Fungal specific transcription factor n=1 Tax=Cordyceps javanica TaxID=43265 RepID=A0A545VW48_9HYPO|nr:Fungal specific transcription factor [Cordyceps javanica]TQW05935.1 Fungal specific transcription factor [Cordyceps javanica]